MWSKLGRLIELMAIAVNIQLCCVYIELSDSEKLMVSIINHYMIFVLNDSAAASADNIVDITVNEVLDCEGQNITGGIIDNAPTSVDVNPTPESTAAL